MKNRKKKKNYLRPDIIIGCETKLSSSVSNSELLPPQYITNTYRQDRASGGGGVIVAIKDGFVTNRIDINVESEQVWVKVQLPKGKSPLICSFYRPPSSGVAPLHDLQNSLDQIKSKNSSVIIAGDFNCGDIDWPLGLVKPGASERAANSRLIDLISENSLTDVQTNPTRQGRVLDICLTNNTSLIKSVSVIPGLSDHDGMFVVDSEISPVFNRPMPCKTLLFKKADWKSIDEESSKFCINFPANCDRNSVKENWVSFKAHVNFMLDKFVPTKVYSTRYNLPWFDGTAKSLGRKKQKLYNRAKICNNPDHWNDYKYIQKLTNKHLKKAHRGHINKRLSNALEENNTKPFWNYIKSLRNDSVGVAPIKDKNQLHSDPTTKASLLNAQFQSVFVKDDKKGTSPIPTGESFPAIDNINISARGVEKLLSKLAVNKASGPDQLLNYCL